MNKKKRKTPIFVYEIRSSYYFYVDSLYVFLKKHDFSLFTIFLAYYGKFLDYIDYYVEYKIKKRILDFVKYHILLHISLYMREFKRSPLMYSIVFSWYLFVLSFSSSVS